jgi:hypothetical protein
VEVGRQFVNISEAFISWKGTTLLAPIHVAYDFVHTLPPS